MTATTIMSELACARSGKVFRLKPGGHNAKYCSKNCRSLSKFSKRSRPSRAGQETYYSRVTKADPEKLALHYARSARSSRILRQWLSDYKMERGCMDCGFNSHPASLQIDHNGEKAADISLLRTSVKRMLTEIESGRCVVRCANCHSIKTWAVKNGISNPSGHSEYIRRVPLEDSA